MQSRNKRRARSILYSNGNRVGRRKCDPLEEIIFHSLPVCPVSPLFWGAGCRRGAMCNLRIPLRVTRTDNRSGRALNWKWNELTDRPRDEASERHEAKSQMAERTARRHDVTVLDDDDDVRMDAAAGVKWCIGFMREEHEIKLWRPNRGKWMFCNVELIN